MNPKELREKLAKIAAETRAMADLIKKENRSFSDEERKKIDGLYAEADSLKARINDLERADKLDAELAAPVDDPRLGRNDANHDPEKAAYEARQSGKPVVTEEHRDLAIQGWLRRNSVKRLDLTDEHREACKLTGLNPDSSELVIRMPHASHMQRMQRAGWSGGYGNSFQGAEQRALSALIGSTGAYTISQTLINQLEVNMLAFGGVLQACDVIRTAKGEDMFWPTVDDTSNSGRQIGESAAITATAQPTFAQRAWGAYKFTSDEILVPYELLEDSAFDIPSVLGEMLGERLGRILNTKFTTGSGAATPNGIVTASSVGKTTASGTAITWDEVTDLIHSIDPAYRNGAAFMFHDGIYQYLRKLKDGVALKCAVAEKRLPENVRRRVFIRLGLNEVVRRMVRVALFPALADAGIAIHAQFGAPIGDKIHATPHGRERESCLSCHHDTAIRTRSAAP